MKTKEIKEASKKPWYIWLSFLGFMILWGQTARLFRNTKSLNPFKFSEEYNLNLWRKACGNMLKLSFMVMLPLAVLLFIAERVGYTNHGLAVFLNVMQLIVLYVLGVYAAYKHHLWRIKNLPIWEDRQ